MPTRADFPLTREQRASRASPASRLRWVDDPRDRHPRFAHGYFLLDLRHADGWISYSTHIHEARFRRMGKIGRR
jgi:hypothetical protein